MRDAEGLELRPVAVADLQFLAEMTLLAAFPPGPLPDGAREMRRVVRWTEGWGRPGDAGVVALRNGERVGAASCRMQDEGLIEDEAGNSLPEIAIAVSLAYQSGGVGMRLLSALESEATKSGHDALSLTVNALNPAHRLYERAGFVQVRREGDCLTMLKRRAGA